MIKSIPRVVWQAHARFPQEEAYASTESVAHVGLNCNDVLIGLQLKCDPSARHSVTREATDHLVVLIDKYHGLHVVEVVAHAHVNLLDLLRLLQLSGLSQGHTLTKLRRDSPVVEVETKCCDHINCRPLNLRYSHSTETLLLLEQLEFWVPQCFQIGPLRLLDDRLVLSCGSYLPEAGSHVLDAQIEVESELGVAQNASLLVKCLSQPPYDLLLHLDLKDSVVAVFFLNVHLLLKALVKLRLLFT